MADKYTKVAASESPSPSADAWKDLAVEKETQPPKVKSSMTYRALEQQVVNLDAQIASVEASKADVQAEMAKVKTAAEKE